MKADKGKATLPKGIELLCPFVKTSELREVDLYAPRILYFPDNPSAGAIIFYHSDEQKVTEN